jgi:Ca2+-binding RTX toxin-like protein
MSATKTTFRPTVESLEDRRVPAVTGATLAADGTLTVNGSANADLIAVTQAGGKVSVTGWSAKFDALKVKAVIIKAGAGDDVVVNATSLTSGVDAGAGSDFVVGGSAGDLILGGDHSDYLMGMGGNDLIVGHAGNDVLYGGLGSDVMIGGVGMEVFYDDTTLATTDSSGWLEPVYAYNATAQEGFTKYKTYLGNRSTPNFAALNGILAARDKFSDAAGGLFP